MAGNTSRNSIKDIKADHPQPTSETPFAGGPILARDYDG